jgi:hypothetical protein
MAELNRQAVAALKARLKAEYDQDMAAIERVERLLGDVGATAAIASPASAPPTEQREAPTAETMIGAVERWFRWFPDKAFTVNEVVDKLREQQHITFTATDPHKSVHAAIWKLQKHHVLRTVLRGKGRKPSTYMLAAEQKPHQPELNGKV